MLYRPESEDTALLFYIHCKGIAHSLKFPCCVSSCTVIVRVRPIPYIIIRNRRISAESFNFSHCQLVHIGIIEDGELVWPLPGHTYISCNSGESDAYGNPGRRGTDIPAPEGTSILAAHSGTVVISGWNDSYGNQVLLDNGAGLSTRYAHMTQTAVTAGEAVTAGQVIGYVGSTGDSTGFHLHFEVMQNGVRVNPLEIVNTK